MAVPTTMAITSLMADGGITRQAGTSTRLRARISVILSKVAPTYASGAFFSSTAKHVAQHKVRVTAIPPSACVALWRFRRKWRARATAQHLSKALVWYELTQRARCPEKLGCGAGSPIGSDSVPDNAVYLLKLASRPMPLDLCPTSVFPFSPLRVTTHFRCRVSAAIVGCCRCELYCLTWTCL
ncbi:unnamed protein product [Laminaria digitata]